MIKKTITYSGYDGEKYTEDFYFNLSRAELIAMETSIKGGFTKRLDKIASERDVVAVSKLLQDIIYESYGEKSADGKRFVKSKELSDAFIQSEAYSELMVELIGDADAASEFVNGLPSGIDMSKVNRKEIEQEVAEKMGIANQHD